MTGSVLQGPLAEAVGTRRGLIERASDVWGVRALALEDLDAGGAQGLSSESDVGGVEVPDGQVIQARGGLLGAVLRRRSLRVRATVRAASAR